MVHLRKLGYGGFAMGMGYRKLKDRYPKAHEAIKRELEDLPQCR
jgi:hypothetical protein